MALGKVYLIGAGPGDPGLLTLRGAEVLSRCDVVLYDALAHPGILEHAREDAELRFVGKRGGDPSVEQTVINEELVALAREGKIVGRLKGGDPLLFARGAEEALFLSRAGVPFEIVPGIASPVAVSAYAGIPLTHRDHASSVLFLTGTPREDTGPDGHDWKRLATRAGTICVLMGMGRLREIASSLIAHGRSADAPAAVIQWGARPQQRTVTAKLSDLADAVEKAGLSSPALVVIGTVVSLREELRWFDDQPLFGKRVLVTRPREQAASFVKLLRERGAEPVRLPLIEVRPPEDGAPLAAALTRLSSWDVVAFTSANGVAAVFRALAAAKRDARAFGTAKIAAIGPGTADALAARGVVADLVAEEHVGEGLGRAILAAHPSPKVLLPRAKIARDALPHMIRAAGGTCDVVVAYETVSARPDDVREVVASVDVVTLTSPSTVKSLVEGLGDHRAALAGKVVASIGPVTTAECKRQGIAVDVEASPHSVPGLLGAIEARFGG